MRNNWVRTVQFSTTPIIINQCTFRLQTAQTNHVPVINAWRTSVRFCVFHPFMISMTGTVESQQSTLTAWRTSPNLQVFLSWNSPYFFPACIHPHATSRVWGLTHCAALTPLKGDMNTLALIDNWTDALNAWRSGASVKSLWRPAPTARQAWRMNVNSAAQPSESTTCRVLEILQGCLLSSFVPRQSERFGGVVLFGC